MNCETATQACDEHVYTHKKVYTKSHTVTSFDKSVSLSLRYK